MKVDLHRHLLGSIPKKLVTKLLEDSTGRDLTKRLSSRQEEFLRSTVEGEALLAKLSQKAGVLSAEDLKSFPSLTGFLQCYVAASCLIDTNESFNYLVSAVVSEILAEGLEHVELTISPSIYLDRGIDFSLVAEALLRAKEESNGVVHWLLDPIRNRGEEHAVELLKKFLDESPGLLSGVSLAGDETSVPLPHFSKYFETAKEFGLGTTCHLGENLSSTEMPSALKLPLDRIGHGLAAINDEDTLVRLIERGVVFEICLCSNLQTGVISEICEHPIIPLLQKGARVTLATDDPFFFDTTIAREFELSSEHFERWNILFCKDSYGGWFVG